MPGLPPVRPRYLLHVVKSANPCRYAVFYQNLMAALRGAIAEGRLVEIVARVASTNVGTNY
jgi:hypothetical protein